MRVTPITKPSDSRALFPSLLPLPTNQRMARSYVALPCALEEEPYNKDLKSTHANDQAGLD